MSFSKRMGYEDVHPPLLQEMITKELQHRCWNLIYFLLDKGMESDWKTSSLSGLIKKYAQDFFKIPIDEFSDLSWRVINSLKELFYIQSWNNFYDFLEFTLQNIPSISNQEYLKKELNRLFEEENTGYGQYHYRDYFKSRNSVHRGSYPTKKFICRNDRTP